MITRLFLFLTIFLLIHNCAPGLSSKKVKIKSYEMLYGQISAEQLYYDYPAWKQIEEEYHGNEVDLEQISAIKRNIKVMVFLGTWCPDSKRNVPAFFKVMQEYNEPVYELWAVDRKKQLDNELISKYGIKRVPTFIFLENGIEIGRITEFPIGPMEENILNILSKKES